MKRCAILLILTLSSSVFQPARASRIKDISRVSDLGGKHLVGYGLVIGLQGSGDTRNTYFTVQSISNMLRRMGINVASEEVQQRIRVRNVAAVMITAELPPFARKGGRIDVIASSIGDAKSLEGGVLLTTPLSSQDGSVYAEAQGPITVGGYNIVGVTGETVRKNYTATGRIPSGAILLRDNTTDVVSEWKILLELATPDYTTASRIEKVINERFGKDTAVAQDAASVVVNVPESHRSKEKIVGFISQIESIEIEPDTRARVVINERTGTVVIGSEVVIGTVAISHGNMKIKIGSHPVISQPRPFSSGETVVTTDEEMNVEESGEHVVLLEQGTSVNDLVEALNSLGASPADIIAIFQAIRQAGALNAELVIM